MKKTAKLAILILAMIILSSCALGEDTSVPLSDKGVCENNKPRSTSTILEDFLSQYPTIFFGLTGLGFNDTEPVVMANWQDIFDDYGRPIDWKLYFTDGNGDVVKDVPFIRPFAWRDSYSPAIALDFEIHAARGCSNPKIIIITYWAIQFPDGSGGFALYMIDEDSGEIAQLGSMIYFTTGGGVAHFTPFANDSGDIATYLNMMGDGFLHIINCENDFELAAVFEATWVRMEGGGVSQKSVTTEELEIILADQEQAQNLFAGFSDINFARMERMSELEKELTEAITQRLRGTFPAITHPTQSPE